MSTSHGDVTSAFVDLATADFLEDYLYGGASAITYFVRQHKKATWFSQVPVVLTTANGSADFGNQWAASISRAGDYLLNTWLEVVTPAITAASGYKNYWCKNLMHNLVEECTISFNDLVAHKFSSVDLDFWTAFTVDASKRSGYDKMIGAGVKTMAPDGQTPIFLHGLDASVVHRLNLPLPFFFSRESGVALPTAAIPYNDMRINFRFRESNALLSSFVTTSGSEAQAAFVLGTTTSASTAPKLTTARVWANYAIVTQAERKLMGQSPREMVIEQMQSAPITTYKVDSNASYDIRFSHSIKALMFGVRNKVAHTGVYSAGPGLTYGAGGDKFSCYDVKNNADEMAGTFERTSPLSATSLIYENTTRLGNMPTEYFTQVNPYYHGKAIPTGDAGIHLYSYSLDLASVDPLGSTNYGKLTNVSLVPVNRTDLPASQNEVWELCVTGINHQIVKVTGGALGFPIL